MTSALGQYARHIQEFFTGEIGRIAATLLIVVAAVAIHRLNMRYLSSDAAKRDIGQEKLRSRVVAIKNVMMLAAIFAIGAIWASKIAGVALSLAAFAGAMVLSAKELIMCGTGYLLHSISRPYRVGDFIEVNGVAGRVIDVDIFCTTVAETAAANQLTGRALTFPNSALLTSPVRNHSATGEFVINLLRIAVPYEADRERCEEAAIKAGTEVCRPWMQQADAHFRRIEESAFLDLPSSRVKVLWEPHDVKQHWMVVRFASPISQRVSATQDIQRGFWKLMASELTGKPAA
ncbi:Small-conductance mechanosensitive channel [compost metagenome]